MAGSVELRLTGGSTNNGPALSLGGVMSSVVVAATSINNLFDNVNQDEAQIGSTDYRAIDIINTSTDYNISSATLYLNPNVNSSSVKIYMGIESTGNPHVSTWTGVLTTAENVAPSGISFAEYPSSAPLSIPDIELDESLRLWFKRVVSPGAFKKCPTSFTLNLDGTYDLSALLVLSVDPADNEVDIALDKIITVVFNESISSTSLSGNISLTADSSNVAFSAASSGSTVIITPSTDLPADADIVCTLSTAITSTNGRKLTSPYQWNFQTLSMFYLFFTCDSLQPSTNDYAPGITISYASSSTDTLSTAYRLYGTGCLRLGMGQYLDISSTYLDDVVKNFALHFYPASTSTSIIKVIEMFNSTGGSLLDMTYNGNTKLITLGAANSTSTFDPNMYHLINLSATTSGEYNLIINNVSISLDTTVGIPTAVKQIRVGVSSTASGYIYVDNIMSAK